MAVFEPRLYAHRGAPVERPENTMASFARAVELGVVCLETDVHMTSDGVVVVAHDPDAIHMAGKPLAWRDATWAQVSQLDAGWGWQRGAQRPFANTGIGVSRLTDVLGAFPSIRFNIDLKQKTPSMVAAVLAVIDAHQACDRVTLASFHTRTLLAVRRAGYRGETALSQKEVGLFLATPNPLWRQLPWMGNCAQVPINAGKLRLDTRWFIDKCHGAGIRVDYWTINSQAEASRLCALGADGIMTDDPAAVRLS